MLTDCKLSVVVPCYMDELNIRELIRRLVAVLTSITPSWEIIYVNDSSPDNAKDILKDISDDERIRVINFSRNFGVMSAFRAGLTHATGDAVVTMDGDLQDPPEIIPEFVTKWIEGYMVVYGERVRRDERLSRRLGYKIFYRLWRWLSDTQVHLDAGEFALIDRSVVRIITAMPERVLFLRGIRSWVGFPQIGVPYFRPLRYAGETTQSLLSYFGWSLKAISSFSVKPLRLISILALFSSLCMLCLLSVNFVCFLLGISAPKGYFTLLFVILLGFTMVLVSLAIISEYLIHIFHEVKDRPPYIIESIYSKGDIYHD